MIAEKALWCSVVLLIASTVNSFTQSVNPTTPVRDPAPAVLGHEDKWLQETYGKVAFLTSIHACVRSAMAAQRGEPVDTDAACQSSNDGQLDISLSNIKTGPMQDILQHKWFDVVDMPAPPREILEVSIGTDEYTEIGQPKTSWQTATAKWRTADPTPPKDVMDVYANWSVERALKIETERINQGATSPITFTRYATYNVTVQYQGKTNNYHALVLFGTDAAGVEKALPEDGYLDLNAFTMGASMSSSDMVPTQLLRTRIRDYPPLKSWLRSHTVTDKNCQTGSFCCVGNQCGLNSSDVEQEFAKPVAEPHSAWRLP